MAREQQNLVLQDAKGCTIRYIHWQGEPLTAVWLPRTRRVDFTTDVKALEKQEIQFEVISEIKKVTEAGIAIQAPLKTAAALYLKPASEIEAIREDAKESEDQSKPLPFFLKYTTAAAVVGLAIVFAGAWITGRFFSQKVESTTVQVFTQEDLNKLQPAKTPVVNVSEHKIQPSKNIAHAKVTAQHHTNKKQTYAGSAIGGHGHGRPGMGTNMSNSGALGVLGGMGPQYHGSGGLNVHATKNNPGIGYGGPAQKGGFERGLLGKGLVATGIGDGSSLQGYGGTSSHGGEGGGAPGFGYGHMKMAGSAGAYFEPLAEDSLIEGGLDRDQINSVIQRNLGEVTYCYEEGLQSHPKLNGRVAVHFVIGSQGLVSTAKVANTTLGEARVENCIVQKLRGWKFPHPTGNVSVRVTYPFVLKRLSQG